MIRIASRAAPTILALSAALAPASAFAALGGDLASVMRDNDALGAHHSVTPFTAYDLHESTTAGGAILRQYVDRGGHVFAVTWRGRTAPDVHALLGEHAAKYQALAQAQRTSHAIVNVAEDGLRVTVMRMPRGWQFAATLPNAIPAGVSHAELR